MSEKIMNDYSKTNIVCLSAHLRIGANGHFHEYHRALNACLSKIHRTVYIGLEAELLDNESIWYLPLIPKSLGKPRPRITISRLKNVIDEVEEVVDGSSVYYIFEGSLYWLLLTLKIASQKKSSIFIVNQFNAKQTIARLTGRYKAAWLQAYKIILVAGKGRLMLSADNYKYYSRLRELLSDEFVKYLPITPSIPPDFDFRKNGKESLILVRGVAGYKLLRQLAPMLEHNDNIKVHGLGRKDLDGMGLKKVSISKGNLDSLSYFKSYENMTSSVFLYDPEFFAFQSSARFIDSHFGGIPVLVPKESSMAIEFKNCHLVSTFDYSDPTPIVDFLNNHNHKSICNCDDTRNGFIKEFKTIILASEDNFDARVQLNNSTRCLLTSVVCSLNFLSYCTLGGTLNILSVIDRVKSIKKRFQSQ
jgi:hypothetical protein